MTGPLPQPKTIVFDLDGTLVNSLQDIADALNLGLTLLGLPPRDVAECRYLVGEGVPKLCARAIGTARPELVPRLIELVQAAYRTGMLVHSRPYPGVPELIARLHARGTPLAVLSNKPHEFTVRVVQAFWADGVFARILGYTEEHHRKPSPHGLLRICGDLQVAPADVWLVGDTATDVATARAAGARPVGVTWGFRTRAELADAGAAWIVDDPAALG